MSAVLEFTRNIRAADSAVRTERAYWLADKEEAEAQFATILKTLQTVYRGSSLSHAIRDLDGVTVHLTDEEAAADHVGRMYERWQDTLDPIVIERFKRFGWPDFALCKEGAAS